MQSSQRTDNSENTYTDGNEPYETDNIQSFRPDEDSIAKEEAQDLRSSKMKLSLIPKISGPPSGTVDTLLDEINSNKVNIHCKEHPDEELQFYSFTNDRALCSDCLLSGVYTGCDVLNLKKAGDRIKPKFAKLLKEMDDKVDQMSLCEEKLANKRQEFDEFVSDCKASITDQMNRLRSAIDKKERELIESVESLRKTKQRDVENKYKTIVNAKREINEIRSALDTRIDHIKELDLCHYYSAAASTVKKSVDEEYNVAIRDLKQLLEVGVPRDQINFESNKQWISSAIENINRLKGVEIMPQKAEKLERADSNQSRKTRTSITKEHDLALENLSIQLIGKKSTLSEELKSSPNTKNKSFFRGASKELDLISTASLPMTTKENTMAESTTDETLRRLFEKIEEIKKTPHQNKESMSSKRDLRSSSIPDVIKHNTPNTKEASKHLWQNFKEAIDDKNKRKEVPVTATPPKMLDLERTKLTPKSFIPDYATSSKRSTPNVERLSLGRREAVTPTHHTNLSGLSNNPSIGLMSTKNLRTLVQEETLKLGNNNSSWRSPNNHLKSRPSLGSNTYTSKSFGANTLSSNLRKLTKEIGFRNSEFGL